MLIVILLLLLLLSRRCIIIPVDVILSGNNSVTLNDNLPLLSVKISLVNAGGISACIVLLFSNIFREMQYISSVHRFLLSAGEVDPTISFGGQVCWKGDNPLCEGFVRMVKRVKGGIYGN